MLMGGGGGGAAAAAPRLLSVQSDFRSCLMCVVVIAVPLQEGGYVLFKVAVTSGLGTRDGEVGLVGYQYM
jgi:hypothetical protein